MLETLKEATIMSLPCLQTFGSTPQRDSEPLALCVPLLIGYEVPPSVPSTQGDVQLPDHKMPSAFFSAWKPLLHHSPPHATNLHPFTLLTGIPSHIFSCRFAISS